MTSEIAARRTFPIEAIVIFPLVGPPVLALILAFFYTILLLFVSLKAIIAFPVYFVFWASMFYGIFGPPLVAAGVLYAVAVRLYAPPHVGTAIVAGAVATAGYWLVVFALTGVVKTGKFSGHVPTDAAGAGMVCALQVMPGWWLMHKIRSRFGWE